MSQSAKLKHSSLKNSSAIFNNQRLTINREYQIQQNQRMQRLLGLVASAQSENERSEHMSEVQTFLKGEQQAISNLMQKLKNVKDGLYNCEVAFNKANATDISEDDEKFLYHVLYQHGYISDKFAKGSLIEIIRQIRQNLVKQQLELSISEECQSENLQYQELINTHYNNSENNSRNTINNINNNINNTINRCHSHNNTKANNGHDNKDSPQNSQSISLQNCRFSRLPNLNNLCSIACQLNSKNSKSQQEGLCSLQLDLINPEKPQNIISKRYLHVQDSSAYDNKACKTYYERQFASPLLQPPYTDKNAKQIKNINTLQDINKDKIKDGKQKTKSRSKYKQQESKLDIIKQNKHYNHQMKQQQNNVLSATQSPSLHNGNCLKINSKTLSSKQTVQIDEVDHQKQADCAQNTINTTIVVNQIRKQTFSGKFGIIDYQIHFSCVRKIILQDGQVNLWVKPFGILPIKFKNNNQSKQFFQSINAYSLTHEQNYHQ